MPYETSTTTGYADLRSRINTFLTSNGWTLSGNILYKGDVFAELTDDTEFLKLQGGQGQSGGTLTDPCSASSRLRTDCWGADVVFSCTYHFFVHTSPDVFLCVINHNTLNVQWLTFGDLNKYGTWAGGQYYGSSYSGSGLQNQMRFYNWRCYFYNTSGGISYNVAPAYFWACSGAAAGSGNMQLVCDIEGSTGDWIGNHSSLSSQNFDGSYYARDLVTRSPNTFNSQATLIPVNIRCSRASDFSSIIGETGHTRYINIKHYGIADIVTLGAEKWMVFPHQKKSDHAMTTHTSTITGTTGETGYLGFAVRYDGP